MLGLEPLGTVMAEMRNEAETQVQMSTEALVALKQGRMIEAIKVIRRESGLGLKDAKDAAELYLRNNPALRMQYDGARAEAGRGGWLWFAIVAGAAIAAFLYFGR
jgi:hypothetical protein